MLERIISAAYDEYLAEDNQELLELVHRLRDKIMNADKLKELFVEDTLLDVGSAYEDVAFKAGFMACVKCLHVLNGVTPLEMSEENSQL
ncbi:MAG: hypothetical protein Q4D29_13675 [Lachnospiraceae bacterium]|nr:hypothetical protein [Lachnospiraceae bacterium]